MPASLETDEPLRTIHHVPATLAAIRPIRSEIADALGRCSWSHDDAMGVVVAAAEGMINAVEHGSVDGGRLTVSYEINPVRAEVTVSDDGRPRRPEERGRPPLPDDTRGRGMLLINGLVTHLRYTWTGSGTVLSMVFERTSAAMS